MGRSYCAVYVDVGYLLASAATRETGTSLRSGIKVDLPALIGQLSEQATQLSGLPLLRLHWYDAAPGQNPTSEQQSVAVLPHVKLRLGRTALSGQQKGVDLRLGLDIVTHARHGAVDVMYLLSGDDDLTEAVEEAQDQGAQVVILAVPDADGRPHAVSRYLQRAADDLLLVAPESLDQTVTKAQRPAITPTTPTPAPPIARPAATPTPAILAGRTGAPSVIPPSAPPVPIYSSTTGGPTVIAPDHVDSERRTEAIDVVCRQVVGSWAVTASPEERARMKASRPNIPEDLDRALLVDLSDRLEIYSLDDQTRYQLRAHFWTIFNDQVG